jgi:hypothetical protein
MGSKLSSKQSPTTTTSSSNIIPNNDSNIIEIFQSHLISHGGLTVEDANWVCTLLPKEYLSVTTIITLDDLIKTCPELKTKRITANAVLKSLQSWTILVAANNSTSTSTTSSGKKTVHAPKSITTIQGDRKNIVSSSEDFLTLLRSKKGNQILRVHFERMYALEAIEFHDAVERYENNYMKNNLKTNLGRAKSIQRMFLADTGLMQISITLEEILKVNKILGPPEESDPLLFLTMKQQRRQQQQQQPLQQNTVMTTTSDQPTIIDDTIYYNVFHDCKEFNFQLMYHHIYPNIRKTDDFYEFVKNFCVLEAKSHKLIVIEDDHGEMI